MPVSQTLLNKCEVEDVLWFNEEALLLAIRPKGSGGMGWVLWCVDGEGIRKKVQGIRKLYFLCVCVSEFICIGPNFPFLAWICRKVKKQPSIRERR
jgi:hypothetical protein